MIAVITETLFLQSQVVPFTGLLFFFAIDIARVAAQRYLHRSGSLPLLHDCCMSLLGVQVRAHHTLYLFQSHDIENSSELSPEASTRSYADITVDACIDVQLCA